LLYLLLLLATPGFCWLWRRRRSLLLLWCLQIKTHRSMNENIIHYRLEAWKI
jgi:hypothetical protein